MAVFCNYKIDDRNPRWLMRDAIEDGLSLGESFA